MSSGRDPMASPPGRATLARLHRPTNGPNTHTDARNCRTAAKSASYLSSSGEVICTVAPDSSTVAPKPRNTSAIKGTSRMSGQLVIVLVPSAKSAAAISLSTLFLAPPTATSPDNRFPPVTTKRSPTRVSLVRRYPPVSQPSHSERYGLSYGSPSDPHLYPHRRRRYNRIERFLAGLKERCPAGGVCRLRRSQRRHWRRNRAGPTRRGNNWCAPADPK